MILRVGETSLDLKSEGMSIYDEIGEEWYNAIMVGFDYGYDNLTTSLEYYYNELEVKEQLGITAMLQASDEHVLLALNQYDFRTKLNTTIASFSQAIGDEHSVRLGAVLLSNFDDTEDITLSSSYFVQFVLNF
jgi:hypothetical protein